MIDGEKPRWRSPMMARCLPEFQAAAAMAATFELRVRLSADNIEALRGDAFKDLSPLVERLVMHYGADITPDDAAFLKGYVVVRNKLLHLELSRASGKLVSLGEQMREAGVWMFDIATGETAKVENTSTQKGRIYGWLWEATGSGAFAKAVEAFGRAVRVLDELRDKGLPPPPRDA